jgi:DNA-binding transcriptional LysR family regulator
MPKNMLRSRRGARSPVLKLVSVTQALLVGEYLSFRRAAGALGVRPSAVSHHVRELEDEIGVSLFERHHAGVRVTNAGARFLQQAREALLQLDQAVQTARTAGSGSIGQLTIGIFSSVGAGYLRELIQAYGREYPHVGIHILEGAAAEHVAGVRKRRLDIAFILDSADATGCEVAPLWSERIFVALPDSHPLCRYKQINWHDLHKEYLIVRRSEHDPGLCDRLIRRLTEGDQGPSVEKVDVGRENLMHLVALGRGVGLTSEATAGTSFRDVVFRPIAGDDELLQFCAVWSNDNDNPALRRFLSLARTMAKRRLKRPGGGEGSTRGTPAPTAAFSLFLAFLGGLARRLGLWT